MKVIVFTVMVVIFSGCVSNNMEEEPRMENISVFSDVFENDDNLSSDYTCDGRNISPDVHWEGIPDGAKSIALIMDDPDAPGRPFVHWVLYNIPANSTGFSTGVKKNKSLEDGSIQGKNDFGRIGYDGPCPPPGKPHRYFFKVYALDTKQNLTSGMTKKQLEEAMSGHILAQGEIIGIYGR